MRQQDLYLYSELTPAERRAVQRMAAKGEVFRIVVGAYTALPVDEWPRLLRSEKVRFLASKFPESVVTGRTAFEGMGNKDGVVFLTSTYRRQIAYPGLTVVLVEGHGPIQGDNTMGNRPLYFPSQARLLLENCVVDKHPLSRCASREEMEKRIAAICESRDESALNAIRDEARKIAPGLGLEDEFIRLDQLIGAVLGTRHERELRDPAARAVAKGIPYDTTRRGVFQALLSELLTRAFTPRPVTTLSDVARANQAFLESYFSNYIEGTKFGVEEARDIVMYGKLVEKRPQDSHDILEVFNQILHGGWRSQTLTEPQILEQLRARHKDMMRARPETAPGEFKDRANFAGSTEFVAPNLVKGTLLEGARCLNDVPPGLARAIYAMFLVVEVHPFLDGNGRLARLVMNSELSAAGETRIIVPTLAREEYLDCLRQLTRQSDPVGFVSYMEKLHRWSAGFDYESLDPLLEKVKACNAFEESRIDFKLGFPESPVLGSQRSK